MLLSKALLLVWLNRFLILTSEETWHQHIIVQKMYGNIVQLDG